MLGPSGLTANPAPERRGNTRARSRRTRSSAASCNVVPSPWTCPPRYRRHRPATSRTDKAGVHASGTTEFSSSAFVLKRGLPFSSVHPDGAMTPSPAHPEDARQTAEPLLRKDLEMSEQTERTVLPV